MAMGFFMDVLEVESVREMKNRDPRLPGSLYARLRLAGGTISCKVRDGVAITPGWSGKVSGVVRIGTLKREFNGRLSDVTCLIPAEIDTWIPGQEVKKVAVPAIQSFLDKK